MGAAPAGSVPIDLKDERLSADRLAEDEWFALAQERLGEGEYREALRALYLGNLAWLHSRELVALDPGKTNREYERELRRRARNSPEAPALFRQNLSVFERCWYGEHLAGPEEIEQFRRQALRMKEVLPA